MTIDPDVYAQTLAAAFGMGALFGACVAVALALACWGAWAIFHRDPEEPVVPAGHPDHPDKYRDHEARRWFEDRRTDMELRRTPRRRQP